MKKIIIIITAVVVLATAAFGGAAYYLNKPDVILARAFSSSSGASSYNGEMELKLKFDTTKLMQLPGIAESPEAQSQIQGIKSQLESAGGIKISFNGASEGQKALMNGTFTLPEILGMGTSSDFKFYTDGQNVWVKAGEEPWTKGASSAGNDKLTQEDIQSTQKAYLDYLKSCPVTINGDTLTISMKPKYEDIMNMIPKKALDEINNNGNGQIFASVMNALSMSFNITVNKNGQFFIPNPSMSRIDIEINGDLSKVMPAVQNVPEEEKAILEGISFTAKGSMNADNKSGVKLEKPQDIQ